MQTLSILSETLHKITRSILFHFQIKFSWPTCPAVYREMFGNKLTDFSQMSLALKYIYFKEQFQGRYD